MAQALQRYAIGKDFTKEQYDKWLEQLTWWIQSRMPNIEDPGEHAKKCIKAALNGTKINGEAWPSITNDFFKRIKQMLGFDLEKGIGVREPYTNKHVSPLHTGQKTEELPPIDLKQAMTLRAQYIADLINKYPHLDTPVYKPKVEELAETVVKSRMISTDFLTARGALLERLSKVRESLHKQIGELMEFLEISPKQRVVKSLEAKNADVGSLVSKMESYGETWLEYERLDALRELIQLYNMLKTTRPDGTRQLNDWELWHMTRSKPIMFTCRHGETYELIGGFSPEEIEEALIQAQKVYGFGLKAITEGTTTPNATISESIVDFETIDEPLVPKTDIDTNDASDD